MALINQQAAEARSFLQTDFAQSFPRGFRALQDMAIAGSVAYKNNGKRAWFGFGRDLSLESMRQYQESVMLLVMALGNEGFLNASSSGGVSEEEQIDRAVALFFTAYPNWPDAEAAWAEIGRSAVSVALGDVAL